MSELVITKQNFENEVIKSVKPVLLDFWASWCNPCKMLSPIVSRIADKYAGKIKVGKVNVDEQPELADEFQVSSIPLVVILQDGKVVSTSVGCKPMEQIEALLPKG